MLLKKIESKSENNPRLKIIKYNKASDINCSKSKQIFNIIITKETANVKMCNSRIKIILKNT